jgi:hypothetical protein
MLSVEIHSSGRAESAAERTAMAQEALDPVRTRPASPYAYDEPADGGGWRAFAGVMLLIAATFNGIYGISALANDDYFVADELLFGDLSMWGIFYLGASVTQGIAALLIFARNSAGAVFGIMFAMLSATLALLSIGAYPLWSCIVLAVDGLIIYGLTVHGFPDEEETV